MTSTKHRLLSGLLSLLMVLLLVIEVFPPIEVVAVLHSPANLTNPSITPVSIGTREYEGYYSGEVSNSSSLTVKWKDVGQEYFNVAVKVLSGEPAPGDNENGEFIYDYTKNYTKTSLSLSLAKMQNAAGKWVKVFIQAHFSDGTETGCHYYFKVKDSASLEAPEITVESVGKSDSLKISWNKITGATGYDIYRSTSTSSSSFSIVKTITSGSTTSWTDSGLNPDTRYYYKVKAFNSKTESGFSNRDYEWTEEEKGSFALSKTSISWGWGSGNEEDVTVTYSGSYSYSVDYDVDSSVKNSGFDYEWLTVTKSGSTLNIRPNRANYSASSRSAMVTVTSNGQSKTVTVTQAKCGESAPSITLWRGTREKPTYFGNGDVIGTFALPQKDMVVAIDSSNVRKVYAVLSTVNGPAIANCSDVSRISFDISNLSAGDYKIIIYASNSDTSNDYWSQRPFAGGSVTLYFSLVKNSAPEDSYNSGTIDDVISIAELQIGKTRSDFSWTDEYCGYFVGWVGRKAGCDFPPTNSDCATGRHLTAWFVNNNAGTFYYFRDNNYLSLTTNHSIKNTNLCIKCTRNDFVPQKGDIIIFLWPSGEASGANWSHVGFVKSYNSSTKKITTIEGNTSNSSGKTGVVAEKVRDLDSQVVAIVRPNYTNYEHVHSYWVGYESEHPHYQYRKCECGYFGGYTGKTVTVNSCSECSEYTSFVAELYNAVLKGTVSKENYMVYLAWYHSVFDSEGRDQSLKKYCESLPYNNYADVYNDEKLRTGILLAWSGIGATHEWELTSYDLYTGMLYKMILGDAGQEFGGFELYNGVSSAYGDFLTPLLENVCDGAYGSDFELLLDQYKKGKITKKDLTDSIGEDVLNMSRWQKIGGVVDVIDIIMKSAESATEVYQRINYISNILCANEYVETVLFKISKDTKADADVKNAAERLYSYMTIDDYNDALKSIILDEIALGTQKAGCDLISSIFDECLKKACPSIAIAKAAVDILFDMKGQGESIYMVFALVNMEDAIFRAAESLRLEFVANRTIKNAVSYITAMDMCFRFSLLTCDYTENHIEQIYKAGLITSLVINQEGYNIQKQTLKNARMSIYEKYCDFYISPRMLFNDCVNDLNTKYSVTYDANGGTGAPAKHANLIGRTTLSKAIPTRDGYVFLGWDENSKTTTPTYLFGKSINLTKEGNVTLYAIWERKNLHNHSYDYLDFDDVHPHKVYQKCSCGDKSYTGNTKKVSGCTECYPVSSGEYNDKIKVSQVIVSSPGTLFSVEILDGVITNNYYYGTSSRTVNKANDVTVSWTKNADKYDVWAAVIDGTPDPGKDVTLARLDGGTGWINTTANSITLPSSALKNYAGKFIKVAIAAKNNDGTSSRVSCFYILISSVASTHIRGDVNGNGVVNIQDATILLRYVNGWDGYDKYITNMVAADLSGDGLVLINDATILLRYANGWNGYDKYITSVKP